MAIPIIMPRLGDFMMEGIVARWAKSAGEQVSQGEVIAEIETEKLNYDLEATEAGILHSVVPEGATVLVGNLLGYLLADGETPPEPPTPQAAPSVSAPGAAAPPRPAAPRAPGELVPSTPGARKLAATLGVDIATVTPTGPRGRVVEADIRAHAEQGPQAGPEGPPMPPGLPEPTKIVPLAGMRKAIAEHMRGSLANTAQLTYHLEIDVTDAQRLRREVSSGGGAPIALAHLLIKACAEAANRVPAINTAIAGGNILYFDQVNMGVAVALDDGLIVPVIRNVEKKDIFQISDETNRLSAKARDSDLSPDEVVGATFTISVLGSVDGFTPILNPGHNALLGIGRSVQKPVVKGGEIVIREMLNVSLTADHQVIDGAVAAAFLRRFQQIVERPAALVKKGDAS